jgi:hypothetical protein
LLDIGRFGINLVSLFLFAIAGFRELRLELLDIQTLVV